MPQILIRHIAGLRVLQVDEFPAESVTELLVGRDFDAHIQIADQDNLVSRKHARITPDPRGLEHFQIEDLHSGNGTYLNHQRLHGPMRIHHNDVVQLGPGGPEFQFLLDPAPYGAAPPQEPHPPAPSPAPSRQPEPTVQINLPRDPVPRPLGRATVERLLGDVFRGVRRESNKSLWIGGAALIATVAVGGAIWLNVHRYQQQQAAAQLKNAQLLDQLQAELAKNPGVTEAMRQQILRLEAELKDSNRQHAEALRQLTQLIEQQNTPTVPAAGPNGADSFNNMIVQANRLIAGRKGREALELATQMIKLDGNRWEGYALGGVAARLDQRTELASSLLQETVRRAPAEQRPVYENLLKQVQKELKK